MEAVFVVEWVFVESEQYGADDGAGSGSLRN